MSLRMLLPRHCFRDDIRRRRTNNQAEPTTERSTIRSRTALHHAASGGHIANRFTVTRIDAKRPCTRPPCQHWIAIGRLPFPELPHRPEVLIRPRPFKHGGEEIPIGTTVFRLPSPFRVGYARLHRLRVCSHCPEWSKHEDERCKRDD